jgi:molecular chaperone DnaJ
MKNYYEILGISKDATHDEIKKTYRKLAVQYHPDKGGDETKFKEIAEAYDTLGDESKRQQYNHKLENPFAGGFGGGNPFGNMDDILNQMFGGGFGQQQQQRRAPEKIIEIQITVLESYLGADKSITYSRKGACNTCNGSGGDRTGCSTCGGQGFVMQRAGTGMFTQIVRTQCPGCNGHGYRVTNPCYSCNGNGLKDIVDTLSINFPRGIDNGQMLRVTNRGDYSNGVIGDLVLKVKLVSENGFEKSNNDLIYNAFFNLDDLNKNEFEIPHPSGKISVKFPKEFNTQVPLRLRQKGFIINNNVGDLFVKMNVKYIRDEVV